MNILTMKLTLLILASYRFRGVFYYSNGVSDVDFLDGDYYYDSGLNTWAIFRAPVDAQGDPIQDANGDIRRVLFWTLGPRGFGSDVPDINENGVIINTQANFLGNWSTSNGVHTQQQATNRVTANGQLYFWGSEVHISSMYDNSIVPEFTYYWKRVSTHSTADIIQIIADNAVAGGSSTFAELTDTPVGLVAGMIPQVNAAGTALEWVAPAQGATGPIGPQGPAGTPGAQGTSRSCWYGWIWWRYS